MVGKKLTCNAMVESSVRPLVRVGGLWINGTVVHQSGGPQGSDRGGRKGHFKAQEEIFFFVRLSIWHPNYDRVKYLKIPELHIGEKREFCASFNTGNALVRTKTTSQIWTLHGLRLRDAPYIRSSFICWTFCQQRDEGFLDEKLLCKEKVVPTFGLKSDK